MKAFRRLPADVRRSLATEQGERVLTFTPSGDGFLVATTLALHLPGGDRIPYESVDRASWDEGGLSLVTTGGERHRVAVTEPGLLPETLRERVNATIVVNKHVDLPGRGGVRLVARRRPGGEVTGWTFVFDEGLDPADPGLRAQAEQALEGVRRSMGV
ncbi:hypothetical protein [Nonomuraea sp. SBT364]|uniref:hypothetical protein n=1 Tax=Nonomuraea sp. SBT364 TaxID=1580530 RepID=UPI00066C0226|nr:hypothetical protein [Nonomuraea sp. SBT364]